MHRPTTCRFAAPGLGLALAGLAALPLLVSPALATPALTTPVAPAPMAAPAPVPVDARAARSTGRPAADPPGSESLWFIGVYQ